MIAGITAIEILLLTGYYELGTTLSLLIALLAVLKKKQKLLLVGLIQGKKCGVSHSCYRWHVIYRWRISRIRFCLDRPFLLWKKVGYISLLLRLWVYLCLQCVVAANQLPFDTLSTRSFAISRCGMKSFLENATSNCSVWTVIPCITSNFEYAYYINMYSMYNVWSFIQCIAC